uniref:Uncharacterized protein n=1 Tax=Klebsiella pneumoniae TaxID=573 RepID=A0A8B0SNG8_KLEPN|nr:hypothetical protein [Klebsiella pneumoniae]
MRARIHILFPGCTPPVSVPDKQKIRPIQHAGKINFYSKRQFIVLSQNPHCISGYTSSIWWLCMEE